MKPKKIGKRYDVPDDSKYCPRCDKIKKKIEFYPSKTIFGGFRPYCIPCTKTGVKESPYVPKPRPHKPPKKPGEPLRIKSPNGSWIYDIPTNSRYCSDCDHVKLKTEFYPSKSSPSGWSPYCKLCTNLRQKQAYSKKPKKSYKVSVKKKRCPACKKMKQASGFSKNKCRKDGLDWSCKECVKKKSIVYNNSPRKKESNKRWAKNNKKALLAKGHRRRAAKRQAPGKFTADEFDRIVEIFKHKCACCGKHESKVGKLTVDHIIPLNKQGHNDAFNLQPLCGSCNSSKGTKIIDYRTKRQMKKIIKQQELF